MYKLSFAFIVIRKKCCADVQGMPAERRIKMDSLRARDAKQSLPSAPIHPHRLDVEVTT